MKLLARCTEPFELLRLTDSLGVQLIDQIRYTDAYYQLNSNLHNKLHDIFSNARSSAIFAQLIRTTPQS